MTAAQPKPDEIHDHATEDTAEDAGLGNPLEGGIAALMIVACGWCRRVRWTAPDGEVLWLEPEEFARRTGRQRSLVSHGICKNCLKLVDEAEERSRASEA